MRRLMLIGVCGVLTLSACGNGDDDSGPEIESFDVPSSADCSGADEGTVEVSWTTENATEVVLFVDDEQVASGADPSGNDDVDVPCDGEDHDVKLEARDDDGNTDEQTASVSTEAGGGGGGGATTTSGSGGTTSTTGGTTTTGATTTTAPNNTTSSTSSSS